MTKYSFDLKHTNIAKGFFVLAMILHHILSPEMGSFIVNSTGKDIPYLLSQIGFYSKICVGGFAFLSAYGITKKWITKTACADTDNSIIITRLVKFYFSFWPIFIIGLIGSTLFGDTPLNELYINPHTGAFSWVLPLIDTLGLSCLLGTPMLNISWWYIPIALFIILATPLFNHLYTQYKFAFIGVICILPYVLDMSDTNLFLTIPALGVMFAREDLLTKLKATGQKSIPKRILKYLLALLMLYITFELSRSLLALPILPLGTFAGMYFCFIVLSDIPVLRNILEFIGKHSANIYFVHTFLYYYWFSYSIYNTGNLFVVYMITLIGALTISIILELCKKIVRYNKLEQSAISHLTKLICK